MSKKNRHVYDRIEDESRTYERVAPDEIEQGLGAVADGAQRVGGGSPFSLVALRKRLMKDLVSTGGRPGRKQVTAIKKIPLTAAEWKVLREITQLIREDGNVKATPSQVAGVLLHHSLSEVMLRLDRTTPGTKVQAQQLLSRDDLEEKVERILAAAASAEEHLEQLRPVARELLQQMRMGKGLEADE